MNDIHLSEVLSIKRREKGITQDELASYIGVSKASVSKWETGISLPDITLLPLLSSYFDISIDTLLGYTPQLSKIEIKEIYSELSYKFNSLLFEDAVTECEKYIKKYYSCYPFIIEMVQLYINHSSLAKELNERKALLKSAIELCNHIESSCRDVSLLRMVPSFLAMCYLLLGEPNKVLKILGNKPEIIMNGGTMIAQAYQALGDIQKSIEVIQVDLFQSLNLTINSLCSYIQVNLNSYEVASIAYKRALGLVDIFQVTELNPNTVAILYTMGAFMYQTAGKNREALDNLEKYVDLCVKHFFPFTIRTDGFFNKIDQWLADNISSQPRNDVIVRESMLNDVLLHPMFNSLHDNPRFINLVNKLKDFIGG